MTMTRAIKQKFCSDRMSSSHVIVPASIFLLIDATAVTLCQGHEKVIQYIFQTYIFFVQNI